MYLVPQSILFMYASRSGAHPNEFMKKLQIPLASINHELKGYLLSRPQYMSMLYKAGIKKSSEVLEINEEEFLNKIDTATIIEELEKRTRN